MRTKDYMDPIHNVNQRQPEIETLWRNRGFNSLCAWHRAEIRTKACKEVETAEVLSLLVHLTQMERKQRGVAAPCKGYWQNHRSPAGFPLFLCPSSWRCESWSRYIYPPALKSGEKTTNCTICRIWFQISLPYFHPSMVGTTNRHKILANNFDLK